MAERQFTVVDDEEKAAETPMDVLKREHARAQAQQQQAARAVYTALQALSQRTIVAISNLFALLTIASVFWLFYSIPDPNQHQLILLTLYAVFVLVANYIVRRK